MIKLNKFEPFFFFVILLVILVPVLSVDYFVTGDGPCHLYNSKILLDLWHGQSKDFYAPFYYFNTDFNPNWLFNLITTPLLWLLSPILTEKIFFILYVLGFGFGFRFLINEINPKAKFISSLGLLFCFHNLLIKGFLNNSLSLVIWFWTAGFWWRHRNNFTLGVLLTNAFLILLLYSAHPIGLTFGIMMILSMMIGLMFSEYKTIGWKASRLMFYKRFKSLVISSLPTFVLFAEYLMRSNLISDDTVHHLKETFFKIFNLSSLILVNSAESGLALATSIICILLFLSALVLRIRQRKLLPTDGLILFLVLVLLTIVFPPSAISGGLEVSFRIAIIPFVALLCWTATTIFPTWIQMLVQSITLIIGICFISIRLPVHQQASDYAKEISTCESFINNQATLLVLNYDWAGRSPEGKRISDRSWLFTHVDCYLGTNKSVVISDNYEAHFFYFPIISLWNTDMYGQTDKEQINFDHRPPRADILSYNRRTGQNIDYVLMISYRDEFKEHPYTQEIFSQLDQGYNQVFSSQYGRAILYKRNNLN